MTTIVKQFDSYIMKYSSYRSSGDNTTFAAITCLKGGVEVATIHFSQTGPLNENILKNNKIRMHVHLSRFNDIMGILRYEKPLQMFLDDVKKEAYISTGSHEPVGEQEGV